jgi:hypothetical protein
LVPTESGDGMKYSALRIAGYRLAANLRQRWATYVALALLIGLVGGMAMTAVAAARRTQSSFPAYLASTNPSTLVASLSNRNGLDDKTSAAVEAAIARIPGVTAVRRYAAMNAAVVGPDGQPDLSTLGQVGRYGSVDGLFFDQDRVTVLQGRRADPTRRDEMVATPTAAKLLGLRLGQVAPWEFVTNSQVSAPDFDPTHVTPALRLDVKLVGLVLFHDALVQDDVDRLPTSVVFTPALTGALPRDWAVGGASFTYYGIQVRNGTNIAGVEDAMNGLTPPDSGFDFHPTSLVTAKAERAVKPESIALAVFGLIALAAVVVIAGQMISRTVYSAEVERSVLRALGTGPGATALEGLAGLIAAIVIGSVLAGAVAIALSPLAPLGPARGVYPHRGLHADWAVLSVGVAILIGLLSAFALALSMWRSRHRVVTSSGPGRASSVVRATSAVGLPPSATIGTRFALEPGRGPTAVPVRSALLGSILTVAMVVTTITFGLSLRTLVSHPSLYGWNWDYALSGNPWVPPQARAMLASNHDVSEWSSVNVSGASINGRNVPVLLGQPGARPAPPVLSGHGLQSEDEIVLGVATMAELHTHVGATVDVDAAGDGSPPKRLRVVGTATMPAVGQPIAAQNHPSMGIGALLPITVVPSDILDSIRNGPDPTLSGPGMVLIRMRTGVSRAAGLADIRRIADSTNRIVDGLPNGAGFGDEIVMQTVQHPAEIVNYRTLGTTPVVLTAGLAGGALIALGLTLSSSVRRRRRDLALLKTLGFSRRQLSTTVAWQASVAAAIGGIAGIPLGITLGRWLWTLFARSIYVVPRPTTPVAAAVLVGVVALALANLAAAVPGRVAARTPTGVLLRAE